jgi:hypothetical protein
MNANMGLAVSHRSPIFWSLIFSTILKMIEAYAMISSPRQFRDSRKMIPCGKLS